MNTDLKSRVVSVDAGRDGRGRTVLTIVTEVTIGSGSSLLSDDLLAAAAYAHPRLDVETEALLRGEDGPFQTWLRNEHVTSTGKHWTYGGAASYASYARKALLAIREGSAEHSLDPKYRSGLKAWRAFLATQ